MISDAVTLRVMLIDDCEERAVEVTSLLESAGCEVVAIDSSTEHLERTVARVRPDVLIIEQEAPRRDTLESMQRLTEQNPYPIVMFVDETDPDAIRTAVQAGVAAYVVRGLSPDRVRPVLDVAIARFEEHRNLLERQHDLERELDRAQQRLTERRTIDRAKGLLMDHHGLTEQAAYDAMRRISMERNLTMGEVARMTIEALANPGPRRRG